MNPSDRLRSGALLAGFLFMAAFVQVHAADRTYPAQISPRDRMAIATKACGSDDASGAQRLDASTRRKNTAAITVVVQCVAHTSVESHPLVHYTTCSNAGGSWHCEAGHDAIHLQLSNAVLPVVPQDVPAHMAIVAVTEAAKLLVPPFHKPAIELLKGSCTVSPHGSSPSPEMQLFEIRCGGAWMLLTAHCWQGGCQYFISQGEGY